MNAKNSSTFPIKVLFLVVVAIFSSVALSCMGTDCIDIVPTQAPDSTASKPI